MRYLCAAIICALMITPAPAAQHSALTAIVDRWDRCFLASTQGQFQQNIAAEPNLVAEIAFLACKTEEDSLFATLVMDPTLARALILRHRAYLKRKITG